MNDRIRIDEPGYVARYRESVRRRTTGERLGAGGDEGVADDDVPSYLRAYRRGAAVNRPGTDAVNRSLRRLGSHGPDHVVPAPQLAADVRLVRHGETIGGEADADLTEQGIWQAHTYGRTLAAECRAGDLVVLRHADTLRSRHTAEHIRAGLAEGLAEREREVTVVDPTPVAAFANVRFVGPDGVGDIAAGFRAYDRHRDHPGGLGRSERPLWWAELDRFWKLQLAGGDPIELWLTTPMLHFEPPPTVVRRLWAGIDAQAVEHPGARLVVATHSGCIRALAVAALGYDPGDLYNLEHVRAKLFAGRRDALVSHRNRYQEICVPDLAELPVWNTVETWQPPMTPQEAAS
jgi:broad specificity phosphatase PhoE